MPIVADYAFGAPTADQLRANDIVSLSRYLSEHPIDTTTPYPHIQPNKNCMLSEYRYMVAHGIGMVLNWEVTGQEAVRNPSSGLSHGNRARNQADVLTHPSDLPIIQSVDRGTAPNTFDNIARYQELFNKGCGGLAQGAYGPAAMLDFLWDRGLIRVGWQIGGSKITGNSYLSPNAAMKQSGQFVGSWGSPYDRDYILKPFYGQNPRPIVPPPPPVIIPITGKDDDMADARFRIRGYRNYFSYPALTPVPPEVSHAYDDAKTAPLAIVEAHYQTVKAIIHINNMTADQWQPYPNETPDASTDRAITEGP